MNVFADLMNIAECYLIWTCIVIATSVMKMSRICTYESYYVGFVSRTEECGCSNLQHAMGSVDFSQLANSLRILLELESKTWSMDHIISIIDELTSTSYHTRNSEMNSSDGVQ